MIESVGCVCAVGFKRKFINALVGSHLLRFAVQRHVGDLSLAHKLWDLLIAQVRLPIISLEP